MNALREAITDSRRPAEAQAVPVGPDQGRKILALCSALVAFHETGLDDAARIAEGLETAAELAAASHHGVAALPGDHAWSVSRVPMPGAGGHKLRIESVSGEALELLADAGGVFYFGSVEAGPSAERGAVAFRVVAGGAEPEIQVSAGWDDRSARLASVGAARAWRPGGVGPLDRGSTITVSTAGSDVLRSAEAGAAAAARSSAKQSAPESPAQKSEMPTDAGRVCDACRSRVPPNARFCGRCGAPVAEAERVFCTACGKPLKASARFCRFCGQAVAGM